MKVTHYIIIFNCQNCKIDNNRYNIQITSVFVKLMDRGWRKTRNKIANYLSPEAWRVCLDPTKRKHAKTMTAGHQFLRLLSPRSAYRISRKHTHIPVAAITNFPLAPREKEGRPFNGTETHAGYVKLTGNYETF